VGLPFDEIARVAEVNMAGANDYPSWLSSDNCRLYMSSSRGSRLQVYVATRQP
jgi:hypothetical protein